jgi:DNA helicase-2/ATP-dependent DNA helicase PcrA
LDEIPDNLIEWRARTFAPKPKFVSAPPPRATGKKSSNTISLVIGDRVAHDTFGLGTVVKISGEGDRAEATINFGQLGEKRLLLRYAPVEKL